MSRGGLTANCACGTLAVFTPRIMWCSNANPIGFNVLEAMNSAWKDKYVRVQDGEERSYSIVRPQYTGSPEGGCWHGELYNFVVGRWETKLTRCGFSTRANGGARGFTQWESFNFDRLGSCPFIPGIRASWIRTLATDGIWRNMRYNSNLGPIGPCWNTNPSPGYYSLRTDGLSVYSWHAYTPNAL